MKKLLLAFQVPSYAMLWFGEVFTQISVNLFNFLLIFYVFSLTKSNTAVSWLVLSFTIPMIVIGIIAGVYVDRWNKKTVLFATNVLRAILLVILAFFDSNLVVIYSVAFLVSLVTQFFIPAESPMIPKVVPQSLLYSANALFSIGLFGSILFAYVLSGPVLIYLTRQQTIFLLAGLFIIGAFFISRIIIPAEKPQIKGAIAKKIQHEIIDVFHLIRKEKSIAQSLFFLAITQILLLIIASIAPGYATEVLKIHINQFPIVFMIPAVFGVVVGAVLLTSIMHDVDRNKIINVGLLLSGLAILLMPFGSRIASRDIIQTLNTFLPEIVHISVADLLTVFAFSLGLANAFVFVPSNTILLESTHESIRGKIYGILNSAVGVLSLLPIIIVGGLSDIIGVGRVITGLGVGILIIFVGRILLR